MTQQPDITVSIRCVNDSVPQFRQLVDALHAQEGVRAEILVVDSSDHDQFEAICRSDELLTYIRIAGRNLSQGRNKGLAMAQAPYVAYTDPDCVPGSRWLSALKAQLDGGAAIAGGKIIPRWLVKPPKWIAASTLAKNHLSLRDLGDEVVETDRLFGANMAFNRDILRDLGGFREDLGRVEGILLGGEDTDICERARDAGHRIIYTPEAVVEHQIPKRRLTMGWTLKRMFYGGVSRTVRGGRPSPVKNRKNTLADLFFLGIGAGPYMAGQLYGKRLRRKIAAGEIEMLGKAEFTNARDQD